MASVVHRPGFSLFCLAITLGLGLGACLGRPDVTGVIEPDPAPDPAPTMEADAGPLLEPAPPFECPPFILPPGFGGPLDAEITLAAALAQQEFRRAREQERLLEAWRPDDIQARYRIEQRWIDEACLSLGDVVDVGRGLFMRNFTLAEGLGNDLAGKYALAGQRSRPNLRRFQRGSSEAKGSFGGPDAISCLDCHWKGGFGGAGDRADNMVFLGDDDSAAAAEQRNPPSLWGAGWVQIIAEEMSRVLQAQREQALQGATAAEAPVTITLLAHGVDFGMLTARPDGTTDDSELWGIDPDLVVKPFGWKGVFENLRSFILASANGHLGLQAEELIAGVRSGAIKEIDLGLDDEEDPDDDLVERELTEGQITAITLFLATTDAPRIAVPSQPEFAVRWEQGAQLFDAIGCASCHVPLMPVQDPVFRTTARLSGVVTAVALDENAASPKPVADEAGVIWVPVFSDFKRHRMGRLLEGQHIEHGVAKDTYLTRRLWGLYNTAPYLHDASAATFDEAIAMHASEGSAALVPAATYLGLSDDDKASLRVFLLSLVRGPAVRIR